MSWCIRSVVCFGSYFALSRRLYNHRYLRQANRWSSLFTFFQFEFPSHSKRAILFGVALRIKRNSSTDQFLSKRCEEYKGFLRAQNYNPDSVDRQSEKALSVERSELLTKRVKPKKKVFPLVLDYNPILPDIQRVIKKHAHLLRSSPELLEVFPPKSVFPAYHRTKNLKDILALSKFGGTGSSVHHTRQETGGCFKCNKKYDLCQKFLIHDTKFQSFATGCVYKINQQLSCTSRNVIYLAAFVTNAKSSTLVPLQQNSEFVFAIINSQCLTIRELVN